MRSHASWMADAIVYGVIPGRFGEPGLRATTARLPALADLGVNTLWLSPVMATLPGNFGYEVVDYTTLRDDIGTEDDLRELVDTAHALGIRVLLDFVPNHTSAQHPYYRDAAQHGVASAYYDFYDRDATGRVTHYFDWEWLPNLNLANPKVRSMLLEAMAYWIREFDVDGYRVDVAWGVRERAPDFWPVVRRELAAIKPDVGLVAEASARDPYYPEHGFDAAYDWTDNLGQWAWHDVWDVPHEIPRRLHAALTGDGRYPAGALPLRFLNNNDTGERFLTRHGVGLTRVALTLLLTVHGVPALYTGDEIGAEFHPYDTVAPIDWDRDPHEFRPLVANLCRLRHRLPSLRSRNFARVPAQFRGPDSPGYAYLRWGSDAPVLVVLNFGRTPAVGQVALPEQFGATRGLVDQLSGRYVTVSDRQVNLELEAFTSLVLTPVGEP